MSLNSFVGTDFQQGLWVFRLLLTKFKSQIQHKKSFRLIIRKSMHIVKCLYRATEFQFSIGIDAYVSESKVKGLEDK